MSDTAEERKRGCERKGEEEGLVEGGETQRGGGIGETKSGEGIG